MNKSPIAALFLTDAYKQSHIGLLPEGTTSVYSNYSNRSTRTNYITHVVNFGLQAFLNELSTTFASFLQQMKMKFVNLIGNKIIVDFLKEMSYNDIKGIITHSKAKG